MDENLIQEFITKINEEPKKPHSIGFVYSIIGEDNLDCYIGKTTTSLRNRYSGHKHSFIQFKKDSSKCLCKSSLVIVKNKMCKMIILFIIPIYDIVDEIVLSKKEIEFIQQNECVNRLDKKQEIDDNHSDDDIDTDNDDEINNDDINDIITIPVELGLIYKIYDDLGIYIGSTIGSLSYRIKGHIRSALIYNTLNTVRVCSSHDIILRNNYNVEVIEFVIVKTKNDLLIKEREWIERTDCVNKTIPIRSYEESKYYHKNYYEKYKNSPNFIATYIKYKNAHKERIKKYQLEWRIENVQKLRDYFKIRHQEKKEDINYVEKRKTQKQAWNQSEKGKQSINEYNNRPEVKDRRKKLYQIKKDTETEEHKQHRKQKQKERNSQIIECCGKAYTKKTLTEHKKTKKHLENNPL
jgi:hypothetical protein